MYDYLRLIGDGFTDEQLIEVFQNVALLNEQPFCKDWVELIASVGVTGMLKLSQNLGGKTITIPELYQVLMVYSALCVLEIEKECSYEQAKRRIIGDLMLYGFDELVDRLRAVKAGITEVQDPSSL